MKNNKILIVEDNVELREFIKICLSPSNEFLEACNGRQGWEVAITEMPDLVITDVMMQEMDGNQLCRKLKKDERTAHLPVIILTANTSFDQQLEGLECGADVYLTKPFSVPVLQSYIGNLLKSYQMLRERHENRISCDQIEVKIEVGTVDKKFMDTLTNVISENLSNAEFSISELTKEVGMSKTALYRKFSTLSHMSIGEFIKVLRLRKAALLLSRSELNVTNVAWEVGFNDRRYFSREFKKFFGNSPLEYTERVKCSYE
ncbi:response regulator [Chitinophagaceae bacterium 26-R-25]|nr:response regulator [Chitinophagaceae bacterium 26-R-25]